MLMTNGSVKLQNVILYKTTVILAKKIRPCPILDYQLFKHSLNTINTIKHNTGIPLYDASHSINKGLSDILKS
jgi:hypothetical protein